MRHYRWLAPYVVVSAILAVYAIVVGESFLWAAVVSVMLVWSVRDFIQLFRCRANRHGSSSVVRSVSEEWCVQRYCVRCDKEWFEPLPQALLPTGEHDEMARFDETPRPASYSEKEWADVRMHYLLKLTIWYLEKIERGLEQGDEWKAEE